MRYPEIIDILNGYENESRKGWYSFELSNRTVYAIRESEPDKMYRFCLSYSGDIVCSMENLIKCNGSPETFVWSSSRMRDISFEELKNTDDYYIADPVFCPYICMVNIRQSVDDIKIPAYIFKDGLFRPSRIKESVNQTILNNIKCYAYFLNEYCYKKMHGFVEGYDIESQDCSVCGVSLQEYCAARFYFDNNELKFCTPGYLGMKNKHRRHFCQKKWLLPYESNNLNRTEVLYIQCTSLVKYTGMALKEKKGQIKRSIETILKEVGLTDYDIIEIRRPYK